jgi:hypothetical protein
MPFHPFSREHLAAVTLGTCITAALLIAAKSNPRRRHLVTRLLAFTN